MSSIVKSLGADLGVIMGDGAERITFVDNLGRVIAGEEALVVWARMIFEQIPGARIAVPVSATHELEKMAAKAGCSVVRTKTNARALMDAAVNEKVEVSIDENCGIIFPAFQAAFDGIFSTVKLLELVSQLNKPLSDIVNGIPEFFARTSRIPCPWEEKGKVMRYAMEFAKDKETRLIDGVKIMLSNDEWVLILPDPDRPFVNVSVESTSEKKVQDLLSRMVAKVEEWKNKS